VADGRRKLREKRKSVRRVGYGRFDLSAHLQRRETRSRQRRPRKAKIGTPRRAGNGLRKRVGTPKLATGNRRLSAPTKTPNHRSSSPLANRRSVLLSYGGVALFTESYHIWSGAGPRLRGPSVFRTACPPSLAFGFREGPRPRGPSVFRTARRPSDNLRGVLARLAEAVTRGATLSDAMVFSDPVA
jgi:hypothetical protein